jgi:hypothetical protein
LSEDRLLQASELWCAVRDGSLPRVQPGIDPDWDGERVRRVCAQQADNPDQLHTFLDMLALWPDSERRDRINPHPLHKQGKGCLSSDR